MKHASHHCNGVDAIDNHLVVVVVKASPRCLAAVVNAVMSCLLALVVGIVVAVEVIMVMEDYRVMFDEAVNEPSRLCMRLWCLRI